ncbi:DRTGG domain-containing protein [Alkaliphilus peptidifermentans]|uniref:DRTGG domain-containing protein n=1 Tax=Alkaliphilus peptidifermentans DSM 18978 TaxID=1120976 RepID=A0A1G5DP22_9FIRM|nr:DRTGG domain-containing protein [Alkaliphilus peptidifermentans]SCY16512.1 DRTGG domain-containing protein [Alkaliphilus peptidifermentans DSM 18978]
MNLKEVKQLLDAEVLVGEDSLDREVKTVFACDLMSDVLAFVEDKTILLTGLVNPHTIRTAEMMDINAVVFVRGKTPDEETLKLARETGVVILTTRHILYNSCGILYSNGLCGANIVHR